MLRNRWFSNQFSLQIGERTPACACNLDLSFGHSSYSSAGGRRCHPTVSVTETPWIFCSQSPDVTRRDGGTELFQDTRVPWLASDFTYIWAIIVLGTQMWPPNGSEMCAWLLGKGLVNTTEFSRVFWSEEPRQLTLQLWCLSSATWELV